MNNSEKTQSTLQVVKRFDNVYLGDSLIQRIEIDMTCFLMRFLCNSALLIKDAKNPDIFTPQRRYKPAYLTFHGVKYFSCPEGNFYLNNTIVDWDAKLANEESLIEFKIVMTGGGDNESFLRSLIVLAGDFSLSEKKEVLNQID